MSQITICKHDWHYDENGYVEQCVPAICLKCGQKGCAHDVGDQLWLDEEFKRKFFEKEVKEIMENKIVVNPLEKDNWQYMKHAGSMLGRHENHVIVNDDGIVTWKEFSVNCESHNIAEIKTALESTMNGLASSGAARDVSRDPVAEEALETLIITMATTTRTKVYERHALVTECEFIGMPRDYTPLTIIPAWL